MKICRDCAYYKNEPLGDKFSECTHMERLVVTQDPVSGKVTKRIARNYCSLSRKGIADTSMDDYWLQKGKPYNMDCGVEARFFKPKNGINEPKIALWQRIKHSLLRYW